MGTAASKVIKVTGLSDELIRLLDERVREKHATGRAGYIRDLIKKDVHTLPTFRQILSPVHEATRSMNLNEDELDEFFDSVRDEIFTERSRGQKNA